ncbi:hypothetical protein QTO34_019566 [Cnephaeus nilssonii]|uniref:Uncharacterized protein n=1 Tax=Cnephaeus nilssonii TaxID=3371016 RepID=A0AA40HWY7_CNENI|nr:hypothetical protein QTO34_019566 [Eptesicus nilssonii]
MKLNPGSGRGRVPLDPGEAGSRVRELPSKSNFAECPLALRDPSGDVGLPVSAQSPQASPRDPTCQRDPVHSADTLRALVPPQVWQMEKLTELRSCHIHKLLKEMLLGDRKDVVGPQLW